MRIVSIGELLVDMTPSKLTQDPEHLYELNPGGAPANVAVAAARQGVDTAMISAVGDDCLGVLLIKSLQDEGIDISGIFTTAKAVTTMSMVSLSPSGERSFEFLRKPGADMFLHDERVPDTYFDDCAILHFGSMSLSYSQSLAATELAIVTAQARGAQISFDPNWRSGIWDNKEKGLNLIRHYIGKANYLKLSESELELITGQSEVAEGSKGLISRYRNLELVVVTLGEDGCYYHTKYNCGHIEPLQADTRVEDTTGAGDAFWGTLLSALCENPELVKTENRLKLEQALFRANIAGALCVQTRGAMKSIPTGKEITSVLNHHFR